LTNSETLDALLRDGSIRACASPFFASDPPPLTGDLDFARIDGMMLGLAVGDALGATSEGLPPQFRQERFGEIRDYLPHRDAGDRSVGLPTDDTQMAFWTLECALQDGELRPERLAKLFASERIFGIGNSVRGFVSNARVGMDWDRAGVESAGNGALMRIAPVLIPHLRRPGPELWADAALAGMITHNDAASIAACVAWVSILWQLLAMRRPPEPDWWIEAYVAVAREIEGRTLYRSRSPHYGRYEGSLCDFLEQEVAQLAAEGLPTLQACDHWYSGPYLLETVPSVLYILMRHAAEPEEAIVRAVNDTWDNDTCGAIVGSAVGALHGKEAIPERWLTGLLGRTRESDDGRIYQLLEAARDRFGAEPQR
jgi:ADP-ribosylglycohydrolase